MKKRPRETRQRHPARPQGARASAWLSVRRLLLVVVVGCAGPPDEELGERDVSVTVSSDDLVVVSVGEIEAGPLLSGSLQPERSATLRAEISGSVLRVAAEPGQSVAAGTVLVQMEDAAQRESLLSARAAATTTEQSLRLARRNAERSQALFDAGAISERQLEDARLAVESAEAQHSDAQARVALAREQLGKSAVRAPFRGIVSERPVSAGDVVQPGSELLTLVDPASMRLEAGVPSTELPFVRVGAPVEFTVTGYGPRVFTGRVSRVTPSVDPVTRQVGVIVTIPNADGSLVGGLYAEGKLTAQTRAGPLVPVDAVDLDTTPPTVLRLASGQVQLVPVEVGLRDDERALVEIMSGLSAGDTVLVGAALALPPGTPVRVQSPDSARHAPLP
jgi:RND family efflux transporter MFP subunit